ncbi:hypothetical protein PVAND_009916 [Polypedilum vanderplanki]|uniref:Uncharacterized protein n=1 Tax=Polypedilum vanderplanki TaxID=319348 RepID=A0A9J6CEQ7_POLVA|nr:hypothetical protein PVAND_009916 [Polypedilum vanderplanki]
MFSTRSRSGKRKYIAGIVVLILAYLFIFARYQTYEYEEVIKNVKPVKVWEFIADFSKMKELNPTILDFKIIADHGNNEDWKYSVEYLEKLSHWPYWLNTNVGHFHVHKVIRDRKYVYLVESLHKTCFYGLYCLKTIGEFQITDLNNEDTLCTETVKYQCPPLLGWLCRNQQSGKSDDDVNFFYLTGANLNFFPRNLENVFKNLELIYIYDSKLIEITSEDLKPFPKLKYFRLYGNPIEVIREDLFTHNPELEVLYLENNEINHIYPKALSH